MKEFRDRVLIPLAIPLAALAVIVFIVLNLSQILLAFEETSGPTVATLAAIVISSAVLFACTWFSAQPGDERSTANMGALLTSGVVLVMGGLVGFAAVQEDEHAEEGPGEDLVADVTATAFDIGWVETELAAAPGDVVVEVVNEGTQVHTFLIENVGGLRLEVGSQGDTDIGVAQGLEAGEYVFFCDVPGHRAAGMEGTLSVAEGAAPAGDEAPAEGETTGGQEGGPEGGAEGGTEGQTEGGDEVAPEGGDEGGTGQ